MAKKCFNELYTRNNWWSRKVTSFLASVSFPRSSRTLMIVEEIRSSVCVSCKGCGSGGRPKKFKVHLSACHKTYLRPRVSTSIFSSTVGCFLNRYSNTLYKPNDVVYKSCREVGKEFFWSFPTWPVNILFEIFVLTHSPNLLLPFVPSPDSTHTLPVISWRNNHNTDSDRRTCFKIN
jgi:hypothetical protein